MDAPTVAHLFAQTVHDRANAPALRWQTPEGAWQEWTWGEYADRASRVASALRDLDLPRGGRVALMMRNRVEFHPTDMGVYLAGGTAFSIYNSSSVEQVAYQLNHSEATIAIVGEPDLLDTVEQARVDAPTLQHVAAIDHPGDVATTVHRWEDIVQHPALDLDEAAAGVDPDDIATFIYTSGTTGPPKAVMLSHRNVCAAVASFVDVLGIDLSGRAMVSYLPMAHIAERLLTHYLAAGTGIVAHPYPDPATIYAHLPVVRPEVFFGPPRVFEKLCSTLRARAAGDGALSEIGLDRCQVALTGAAPPPLDVIEFFRGHGLALTEAYGLSESTGLATAEVRNSRPGTVGRPVPGCEIKLLADGEVLLQAPFVFKGYFKDAMKSYEALDVEGWLHTGDIGELEDGYLRIIDRKKELLVTSGGKNVAPAGLESALKEIPLVGQACVVGDRRPYVAALLVLDQEAAIAWASARGFGETSLEALAADPDLRAEIDEGVAAVNARVSNAERIKRFALLADEWPADSEILTPTMKLKRRAVMERYDPLIEALYAGPLT